MSLLESLLSEIKTYLFVGGPLHGEYRLVEEGVDKYVYPKASKIDWVGRSSGVLQTEVTEYIYLKKQVGVYKSAGAIQRWLFVDEAVQEEDLETLLKDLLFRKWVEESE